jgi:hypothetical protein
MEKTRLEIIEELARLGSGNTQSLLGRAYDAGRLEGYEQGRLEIAAQMQSLLSKVPKYDQRVAKGSASGETPSRAKVENRAAPGTVRPAIEKVMASERRGMKADEVLKLVHAAGRTDIKSNTVRGTLNMLRGKGITEKRNGLWFLVDTKRNSGETVSSGKQEDFLEMTPRPH